jgi:adenylosuccinate lyase
VTAVAALRDGNAAATCPHERAHITDSWFHGNSYATPVSRQIFCDVCRMQRWLDVEVALALSAAEVGLIPDNAAEEIARCARVEALDLDALRRSFQDTGHSLVPLLRALEAACDSEAGQYVHYGATTQDIQDTAQVLEMRDVLDAVDAQLADLFGLLKGLAVAHRDSLMIGRTHARAALPTTFGIKVASWLDELLRHAARLDDLRGRALVVELYGGVGTMAGFGGLGPQLVRQFAARLSLAVPLLGWHVSRDRVAEFVTDLAMLTATLARMGEEIRTLGRPEFGELEEGWRAGRVGSSTMPHKRNPEMCEQLVVLSRLARANAALGLEAMVQEHERDSRGLRLEWAAVADVAHHALAALTLVTRVLRDLRVHDDAMARAAHEARDQICTEALMLALGRHIGKQRAYAVVYALSQRAQDDGSPLWASVCASPEVTEHLNQQDLDALFDPGRQLGEAGVLVDGVLAALDQWMTKRNGWHAGA